MLLLSVTATAAMLLTTQPVLRVPCGHPRCSTMIAQLPDWVAGVDRASGETYYYNEWTGEVRWEPPPEVAAADYSAPHEYVAAHDYDIPQDYGAEQVLWILVPTEGVHNEYQLRNGDELVLGCNIHALPCPARRSFGPALSLFLAPHALPHGTVQPAVLACPCHGCSFAPLSTLGQAIRHDPAESVRIA